MLDTTARSAPVRLHDTVEVAGREAAAREMAARDVPSSSPLIDLLRLYRVRQWVHILPLPLATFDTSVPTATALLAAARGMANLFAILAFGFLVNAISDRYVDRDARKNPLVVPGRNGYKLSLIALPAGFSVIATAFTALLLQNQLIHESGDRIEDEASGIHTTWLAFGPRWTAFLAAGAGAVAIVMTAASLGAFRYPVGTLFIGAFPLLLAWDGLTAERAARLRVVHRWCAVLFGAALYAAWRDWV